MHQRLIDKLISSLEFIYSNQCIYPAEKTRSIDIIFFLFFLSGFLVIIQEQCRELWSCIKILWRIEAVSYFYKKKISIRCNNKNGKIINYVFLHIR